jgi:hypothetical protein
MHAKSQTTMSYKSKQKGSLKCGEKLRRCRQGLRVGAYAEKLLPCGGDTRLEARGREASAAGGVQGRVARVVHSRRARTPPGPRAAGGRRGARWRSRRTARGASSTARRSRGTASPAHPPARASAHVAEDVVREARRRVALREPCRCAVVRRGPDTTEWVRCSRPLGRQFVYKKYMKILEKNMNE